MRVILTMLLITEMSSEVKSRMTWSHFITNMTGSQWLEGHIQRDVISLKDSHVLQLTVFSTYQNMYLLQMWTFQIKSKQFTYVFQWISYMLMSTYFKIVLL